MGSVGGIWWQKHVSIGENTQTPDAHNDLTMMMIMKFTYFQSVQIIFINQGAKIALSAFLGDWNK